MTFLCSIYIEIEPLEHEIPHLNLFSPKIKGTKIKFERMWTHEKARSGNFLDLLFELHFWTIYLFTSKMVDYWKESWNIQILILFYVFFSKKPLCVRANHYIGKLKKIVTFYKSKDLTFCEGYFITDLVATAWVTVNPDKLAISSRC